MPAILLEGDGGGHGNNTDTLHVEETVVASIKMKCDFSVVNKATDQNHIDFTNLKVNFYCQN